MRNSDPGVSIVFVHRHNSDLNSVLTVQVSGCNFQYGSNFGVSLGSQFMVQMNLRLLAECIHDKPLHGISESSAVSFVMKYCPISAEESNPAPHIHEQMTTSNHGYDIAYNFTHNNIMLEHNAMNNKNTVAHMDVHNTQY